MEILVNIGWSILLVVFFVLVTWLFENKLGNDHNFISFMLYSIGMCYMIINGYLTSIESAIGWIGLWLLNLLFSGTFISSMFMSFQCSCLCMFGLSMLPEFSYTWSSAISNVILSKTGIITEILILVIFFIGIMTNDNKTQNNNETNADVIDKSADNFTFASHYIKNHDESEQYYLYSSGDNWATLKDENGNQFNVHIWNESNGSIKDELGNIYYPL